MTRQIVNLVTPTVVQVVDEVLDNTTEPIPSQLSSSNSRQRLVDYVVSKVPGVYAAVETQHPLELGVGSSYESAEWRQHLKCLVHQGIRHIADEQASQPEQPELEDVPPSLEEELSLESAMSSDPETPSHWFG